jgi:hypothetical protein
VWSHSCSVTLDCSNVRPSFAFSVAANVSCGVGEAAPQVLWEGENVDEPARRRESALQMSMATTCVAGRDVSMNCRATLPELYYKYSDCPPQGSHIYVNMLTCRDASESLQATLATVTNVYNTY